MDLKPAVNATLSINGATYTFTEHPAAKGMPYGQSGRRATVYQVRAGNGRLFAIKIFTMAFRSARVADGAERLKPFIQLPGMQVCDRQVITPAKNPDLLQNYENLLYAALMPWVYGETWQEFIMGGRAITEGQSRAIAQSFAHVLRQLESRQIAHCDLSGPNVLLPGFNSSDGSKNNSLVALVDVEDLYAPQLARPEKLPAGSSGYAHYTSPVGVWQEDGDRFAGAVLLSEMLGWCDEQVRQIAYGEQYFDLGEMQQNSERYQVLSSALRRHWGAEVAALLSRAWESKNLSDCPRLTEWSDLLGAPPASLEGVVVTAQSRPAPAPVQESPGQKLARAAIERSQAWSQIGQTDKAISELEDAYRFAPELVAKSLANTYLQRGEGKERTGDLNGALFDFQKALSYAPPGGLRDELVTIVAEVNHKIELARSSQQVKTEKCPRCQRDLLPNTEACPYCGYRIAPSKLMAAASPPAPMFPPAPPPQPRKKTKTWLIASIIVGGLGLLICVVVAGLGMLSLSATATPNPNPVANTPQPQANIVTKAPATKINQTAAPTLMPGKVTIPISQMANKNPWLPYTPQSDPCIWYVAFNMRVTPFDKLGVRQALAAAVDRTKLNNSITGFAPATTFTPSGVLGLDLYNQVGIPFNLDQARVLLAQAGYAGGSEFPATKMLVYKHDEPGANLLIAMWRDLGIQTITLEIVADQASYFAGLKDGSAGLILTGWFADYMDPDDFLNVVFHSGNKDNYSNFADAEFDSLVEQAAKLHDASQRQDLYVQAERILTEKQTAIIPLFYYLYTRPTPGAATSTAPITNTFFDDFSSPSQVWPVASNENETYGFTSDGKYAVTFLNPKNTLWIKPGVSFNTAALKDVVVEFTATMVDGWDSSAGTYGIDCHATDAGSYYVGFANGFYEVIYRDDKNNNFTSLLKDRWTSTTAIQQNDNHVKISCVGNTITVWVNDQLLVQANDPQALATSGVFNLVAGAADRPSPNGVKILFDNFSASIP